MAIKESFRNRIDDILFLSINQERIKGLFGVNIKEEIYMPISAKSLIEKIQKGNEVDEISIGYFVEGMFTVLGLDKDFKFNRYYIELLKNLDKSVEYVKGLIAKQVRTKKYEEAYILLKGLSLVKNSEEVNEKLLMLANELRKNNKDYDKELLDIIEMSKEIQNNKMSHIYYAEYLKEKGDSEKALFHINEFIRKGGTETTEITDVKESLKRGVEFSKAKELVYDNPEEALKILVPFLKEMGNEASIYYYIAIAYRNLENFDKAIFYLNDGIAIDNSFPEMFNEMGINLASIGNYKDAIEYLRKAFEATKSIEICTNLIMCYLNIQDEEQAKYHFELAKKIDENDDVLKEIERYFN